MEEIKKALLRKDNVNRRKLIAFKNAAVACQMFELSAMVREIETEHFPETEEERKVKEEMMKISQAFNMVGLHIPLETCYLITETIKANNKMKGNFDLKTASKIQASAKEIFNLE